MSTSPLSPPVSQEVEDRVRSVLADVLSLPPECANAIERDTELFGAMPELDSMAVAGILTELEDRLDILIDDDEVDGDMFATFGALTDFVRAKVSG